MRIKDALSDNVIGGCVPEKANEGWSDSPVAGEVQGGMVCCVCLSIVEEGEEKRVLPCMHEFHSMCVDRWFNACRKTCPVCRFSMGEEEEFQKREELTEELVIWFSSFHVAGF